MQFLLAGLVVVSAVVTATVLLSRSAASDDALNDARATTAVLATSVAEPAIPRGLADGDVGAVDRFDRVVLSRLLVNDVRRIKVWNSDGTIVYSDETRLIGQTYDLGDEELEILHEGGIEAEVTDLDRPENRFEPHDEGLVEVYTAGPLAGGRAAALRGLLLPRRHRAAADRGDDAVPADRARQHRGARRRGHRSCSGCSTAASAAPPRSASACCATLRTPRRPSAAASPATCTTASSRTSPVRRSRSPPWPTGSRPTSAPTSTSWPTRCAGPAATCARCWSRSTLRS